MYLIEGLGLIDSVWVMNKQAICCVNKVAMYLLQQIKQWNTIDRAKESKRQIELKSIVIIKFCMYIFMSQREKVRP